MVSNNNIPVEILKPILFQLPRDTIYQCLFVSKVIHLISEVIYYSEFESPYNHRRFYRETKRTRYSGKKLPSLIEKLCVRSSQTKPHKRLSQKKLYKLIKRLNHLEQFEFDTSYGTQRYLNFLLNIPFEYFPALKEVHIRLEAKELSTPVRIQEFYFLKSVQYYEYHILEESLFTLNFQVNRRLSRKITRLAIGSFVRTLFGPNQHTDDIFLNVLDHVDEAGKTFNSYNDFNLEYIFHTFSRLKELNIRCYRLKQMHPFLPLKPKELKRVSITLDDASTSDIKFMTRVLPIELEYVNISILSCSLVEETENELEWNTFKALMSHISRNQHVRFGYSVQNYPLHFNHLRSLRDLIPLESRNQRQNRKVVLLNMLRFINSDHYPVHLTVGFSMDCNVKTEYYSVWMDRSRKRVEVCILFHESNSEWVERLNLNIYNSLSLRYDHDISPVLLYRDLKSVTDIMNSSQKQRIEIGHPKFEGRKCHHINVSICFRTKCNTAKIRNLAY